MVPAVTEPVNVRVWPVDALPVSEVVLALKLSEGLSVKLTAKPALMLAM